MKLIGIMPVRNEDWVLGFTLRVALKWCDEVLVYLHASEDDSDKIAREVYSETRRVGFAHQFDPAWDEMRHRQDLLRQARDRGATHIALIDADEFLAGDLIDIRKRLILGPGTMLYLPCYNIREDPGIPRYADYSKPLGKHLGNPACFRYHSNGIWGNRWIATAFQDSPGAHWGGRRFHHREPMGVAYRQFKPIAQGDGGVIHLWGASERRLRAKHALYRITERLQFPDYTIEQIERTYSPATTVPAGGWTFASVKPEWIDPYADLMQYLHIDKEPWQIAEVKRAIEEYGYERFIGLDLLGVDKW